MLDTQYQLKAICIYATKQSVESFAGKLEEFCRDTALQRLHAFFGTLPVFASAFFLEQYPECRDSFRTLPELQHVADAARHIRAELQLQDGDSIALFDGLYPLFDAHLFGKMLDRHWRTVAHYSYPENIPAGLVPDLLQVDILAVLPSVIKEELRQFVFQNMDTYDVELFYELPDLRSWRLDLRAQDPASQRLVSALLRQEADCSFATLESQIKSQPELLSAWPACLELELCTNRPVDAKYRLSATQWNAPDQLMSMDFVARLCEQSNDSRALPCSVILGGQGDPLLHPEIEEIVRQLLQVANIKLVVLETWALAGTAWIRPFIEKMSDPSRFALIIRLNTIDADLYAELHQCERARFSDVMDFIAELQLLDLDRIKRPLLYAEFLRLKQNDDQIDAFYKYFRERNVQPLIGKYNPRLGSADLQAALDLSPLIRDFCWHLTRDAYISPAGMMTICKQDPYARLGPAADLNQMDLATAWQRNRSMFLKSFRGQHEQIPVKCLDCDEWYTFNF
ncbi:MAG: spiro-SPASM protein [Leptospiraceae bacterium]|nr:spiro-SPASM protein [Leptospiraceae bacterium]